MQNKSFTKGRSPGLRMIHGEHDFAGIGTCAFPCRVDNTGAQWLDADSLIRLPLRGQRGFCLADQQRLEHDDEKQKFTEVH
jgi:hypothetical protein